MNQGVSLSILLGTMNCVMSDEILLTVSSNILSQLLDKEELVKGIYVKGLEIRETFSTLTGVPWN
jgi:hypothetical protein